MPSRSLPPEPKPQNHRSRGVDQSAEGRMRDEVEHWLLERGAPHFIEGYRATTNVWTRAFPALIVLWVLGLLVEVGLVGTRAPLLILGGIAAVIGVWCVSNVVRKRPLFMLPDSIGPWEIALFATTPALLSIVLERRPLRAIASLLVGALLLVVLYLTTSYAIVPLTRYVLKSFGRQARLIGNLSSRAIPLLLLITVAIFLTSETWQMSARLTGVSQVATIALFVIAGGLFLLTRVPREVAAVERFETWDEVQLEVTDTPAARIVLPPHGDPHEPPLSRGQRTNLVVMALTTQAIQITLVALVVYSFFVVLGTVAINPETATLFIGRPPTVLVSAKLGASQFAITEELLRVAGFLAAFSGLSFTVYLVTDSTYREEFASDVSKELREVLAVRLAYRHLLDVK